MSTLTKLALGVMGRLRPRPAIGDSTQSIALPPAEKVGGMPLMEALSRRRSSREFSKSPCRGRCSRTCCGPPMA